MADSGIKINKICLSLYCAQKGNEIYMENKFRNRIMKLLIREIGEQDQIYYHKNRVIDEDDLEEECKLR